MKTSGDRSPQTDRVGPRSATQIKTDVFYRSPSRTYPTVVRGEGVYLYDTDAKRYLDGSSGAVVATIGHGRDEVGRAMAEQASRVAFAHTLRFTNQPQEELASLIAAHVPRPLRFSYFVSGGSEATETAVKLSRQWHLERGNTTRTKILFHGGSYHGNTLSALAASGYPTRRRPYAPLFGPGFVEIPPGRPEEGRCGGGCECIAEAREVLLHEGPETIAACIVEVVTGSARSAFRPHRGYLAALQRLCHEHDILFVADEVMTGVGRTGRWLASEHEGLSPDIVTLAKGLSGGYAPLAAVVASDRVHDVIRSGSGRFEHGFTYVGHPVTAAAGVATLRIVDREGLVERAAEMGSQLGEGLRQVASLHPMVDLVRGTGLMWGLVLRPTPQYGQGRLAASLGEAAFERGLLVYPGTDSGIPGESDHLLVAPPLTINHSELRELLDLLDASLSAVEDQLV